MQSVGCQHRFIDRYSHRCLHCGYEEKTKTINDDGPLLEQEHYERLVIVIDQWKKNMFDRIESIAKSKLQRLRDEFERQQLERRRQQSLTMNFLDDKTSNYNDDQQIDFSNLQCRWIRSSPLDTEYSLMAMSSQTILLHDGRMLKLFDFDFRTIIAFDLNQIIRERSKIVDLCYVQCSSAYLILFEHSLWNYPVDSSTIKPISAIKRKNYLSLTTNNQDLFLLDAEGTIEQRSLISFTYLRRFNREHLLNDHFNDQILVIRFHSINIRYLMAIVRTTNNRRCLMFYQHYGSNTLKLINRILLSNINIYSIASMDVSHRWLITSCERQLYVLDDEKQQDNLVSISNDCDHRIKNSLTSNRWIVIRTIKPSQIRLYQL